MGRGLAYILGGALQGAGQGIVQQKQQDDLARRDAALASIRSQQVTQEADLNDRNNARSAVRTADVNRENREDTQGFQLTLADKSATAQERAAVRDRDWKKEDDAEAEARTMRLEAFKSDRRLREVAVEAGIDASKVKDVITDEVTGAVSVITNGGQSRILPNIIARRQPKAAAPDTPSYLTPGKPAVKPTATYTYDAKGNLIPSDND